MNARTLGLLLVVSLISCSGSQTPAWTDDPTGRGGGSNEPVPDLVGGGDTVGGDPVPSDGCSDAAKLVYLFTDKGELWSFDPPSKQLSKIGALSCPGASGLSPNSMAVGRDAVAWVNYAGGIIGEEGTIFKVDLATNKCSSTNFSSSTFTKFGMGFSTDGAGSTSDTLFIAGTNGEGLGQVDTKTMKVTSRGKFKLSGLSPELTGTGDGRLYGFFVSTSASTPAHVARIDKTNAGLTEDTTLKSLTSVSAWAFSFWGGDFYLYAAKSSANTTVYRYQPSTRVEEVYIPSLTVRVVGAGVSTCAPIAPPK